MMLRVSNGDLTADFERLGGMQGLLTILTNLFEKNKEDYEWFGFDECDSIAFPYVRLWFNVARPIPENQKMIDAALAAGGITMIGDYLELMLSPKTASGRAFPQRIPMTASDLLRCLVGLTIEMGPLGANKKDLLVKYIPKFQKSGP